MVSFQMALVCCTWNAFISVRRMSPKLPKSAALTIPSSLGNLPQCVLSPTMHMSVEHPHTVGGLVPLSFKKCSLFELLWITAKKGKREREKKAPTHLCTLLEWQEKLYDTVIVRGGSMPAQGTPLFASLTPFDFIGFHLEGGKQAEDWQKYPFTW